MSPFKHFHIGSNILPMSCLPCQNEISLKVPNIGDEQMAIGLDWYRNNYKITYKIQMTSKWGQNYDRVAQIIYTLIRKVKEIKTLTEISKQKPLRKLELKDVQNLSILCPQNLHLSKFKEEDTLSTNNTESKT